MSLLFGGGLLQSGLYKGIEPFYMAYGISTTNFFKIKSSLEVESLTVPSGNTSTELDVYSDSFILLGTLNSQILKTTNGGSTWTNTTPTLPVGASQKITGISIIDNNKSYFCGNGSTAGGGYAFYSTDAGQTWNQKTLNTLSGNNAVYSMASSERADGNVLIASDDGIYTDIISNGYSPINKVIIETGIKFYDVSCDDLYLERMYAVGGNGSQSRIYMSNDYGASWTLKYSSTTETYFQRVKCKYNEVWVIDNAGNLYKSTNNGTTLTLNANPSNADVDIKGGDFAASEVLVGKGDAGYYSSNSGNTYSNLTPSYGYGRIKFKHV